MVIDARKLCYTLLSAVLVSTAATADDVRVLSWEELLPEGTFQQPSQQPNVNEGEEWDWEEDSFDEAFSTPVFPVGVVEELNEKQVKLPGFIVPLEMGDGGKVGEFLLVPYFGACIHYPAPPPNQIVYVTMPEPVEVKSIWDPVWVTGEMRTESRHSELGSAGYTMAGNLVEVYEY